jgi:hypothetical protein
MTSSSLQLLMVKLSVTVEVEVLVYKWVQLDCKSFEELESLALKNFSRQTSSLHLIELSLKGSQEAEY